MKKSFPGFTVLVERALRMTCIVGVVTLAACGGGSDEADDAQAAGAENAAVVDHLSAGTRTRTTVGPGTTDARRTNGIVLSEKMDLPIEEEAETEDAQ